MRSSPLRLTWLIAKPGVFPPLVLHSPSESYADCYSIAIAPDNDIDRLPRGLRPYSVFTATSSNLTPGFPQPGLGSTLRFSQPLSALLHLMPPGLVSCRYRSWGLPFRAFPYAIASSPLGNPCPHAVCATITARCRLRQIDEPSRVAQPIYPTHCTSPLIIDAASGLYAFA